MTFSVQAVLQVIDALNAEDAPYIVTGSMASNLYCTPRSTIDADFVVEMGPDQLERFLKTLQPEFEREPQIAFETVTGKTMHKLRHRDSEFLIEIFEANMDDPHERSRFQRRRAGNVEGRTGFVPTAEDVVVQKLRWFKQIRRLKDREDVRLVMIHQFNVLDWTYLEHWCREHETLQLLDEVKHEVEKFIVNDASGQS